MPDVNDMDLLRDYAGRNSEPAFAELVHRHVNWVYSVALRYVGNSQDAQDVTQAVFIILAKKVAGLRQRATIIGWLYETTRFTCVRFLRTKARLRAREQEAYVQSTLNDSDTDSVWRQLAPLLEEAMTRLNEKERALLALRFFENKSSTEAAGLLGIQEWAARKRVARALEKLQKYFLKHGITSTTEVIAGAISTHSVQAAPVALAKSVISVALAKGAAASSSTLTLIQGALKIMAWTKAKTAVVGGAILILAAGTTTVVIKHYSHHLPEKPPLTPANIASFERESTKLVNDAKWATLGCLLFADGHQNRLPKNFAELKASGVEDRRFLHLSDSDWEFVAGGNKDSFANPDTTIYFLEKEPRQSPDGKFVKVYATVNGRVFLVTSPDEDFIVAEKERGFLVQRTKN